MYKTAEAGRTEHPHETERSRVTATSPVGERVIQAKLRKQSFGTL